MTTSYWSTREFAIALGAGDQNGNALRNAIIDIDGDGDLDLVSSRFLYPAEDRGVPIAVMLNNGSGIFTDATSALFTGGVPTTVWPRDIVIADFNGDGRPDLYIADHGYDAPPYPGAQNRLLLSVGAHGIIDASDRLPQVRDFTHSAAAADIDGDGDIDLLAMNIFGGTPSTGASTNPYFLINDGSGHFAVAFDRLPAIIENRDFGNKYTCVLFFDADHDGDQDILLGSHGETAQNNSLLLLNGGGGNYSTAPSIVIPPGPFTKPGGVMDASALDLNGDGALDLVLTLQDNYQAHYIQILINDGHGHFTDDTNARLPQSNIAGTWSIGTHVVDLNGDGYMDLVAENSLDQPFFLNDGTGHFIALPANFIDVETYWNLQVFDANGDGRQDVLAFYGKFGGAEHYRLYTQEDGGLTQTGDSGVNALLGDADGESFFGMAGDDVIFGGAGDDIIDGGAGNDTLVGGPGTDIASYASATSAVTVSLALAPAQSTGGSGVDTLSGVENLKGSPYNDTLTGDANANVLDGAAGNDLLAGGDGSDIAVFSATRSNYRILAYNATIAVLTTGADGHDRLQSIESLQFSDGTIAASLGMVFDPWEYLASYADLINGLGSNAQAAFDHYIDYGFAENRALNLFDALGYLAANEDLIQAFGLNLPAGEQHFVQYGYNEGRSTHSFDALEYIASNPDLIQAFGLDLTAGTQHYVQYGFGENRATHSFDALEYIASNIDLIQAFGLNLTAGEQHYVQYGYYEGRLTHSFDALEYIASNADLIQAFGANLMAGEQHYVHYGYYEGRATHSFDALEYIASNADLITAFGNNPDAGAAHYIQYGVHEGRSINGFDNEQYLANYADLQAAFGDDPESAAAHFIAFGHNEGRTDQALPGKNVGTFTGNGNNNTMVVANGDTMTGAGGNDTFVFKQALTSPATITDFNQGDTLQVSASGFGHGLAAGDPAPLVSAGDFASASHSGNDGYFIFDNAGANAGTVYWDATGGNGADAAALVRLNNVTSLFSSFHLV
jgi:hypothetical protein